MLTDSIAMQAMDDLPCGFIASSENGDILQINNTLLKYLEYTPEEFIVKNLDGILSLPSRIFYQTHFYPLMLLKGHAEEIYLSFVSKNRTEVPVLVNASKKNTALSFVIHWIIIPVNQRNKYEEQLQKAKKIAEDALLKNEEFIKAKSDLEINKEELDRKISRLEQKNQELLQFTEVISHDLQEPLRKISLFSDLLLAENKHSLTPKGHYSMEIINKSCNRMREIVLNLEKLISLQVNEEQLVLVDLNEVLSQVKEKIIHETGADLDLHNEILPVIEGYPQQLAILFYQLIHNSLKFREPSRPVIIRIQSSLIQHNIFRQTKGKYRYTEFVKITYSDNGTGFENTYKDYIFLILKKLQTDIAGPGFGLAFCKKVVDNHLGSISAEAGKDEGAIFTILLPMRQSK